MTYTRSPEQKARDAICRKRIKDKRRQEERDGIEVPISYTKEYRAENRRMLWEYWKEQEALGKVIPVSYRKEYHRIICRESMRKKREREAKK